MSNRLSGNAMQCIFSVDVEDWFHILELPNVQDLSGWDALPSLVERNFLKLMDLLSEQNARSTCFFLGWVAKKFPRLVAEASRRGHEIASHGFAHRLAWCMTHEEFLADLCTSKAILEQIVGNSVLGYRAAGFSVKRETPWFFEKVIEAGYAYDSSVFPAARAHGGFKTAKLGPHVIHTRSGSLFEFPITVQRLIGCRLCFFGGGYLRLTPYALIRQMAVRVLREGRPVLFYIHPREIDPGHPRLKMGLWRRFKSYVNLSSSERKIRQLTSDFQFVTYQDFISKHRSQILN